MLDRWVARLAPGIIAAAAHGAIRTAHAARSLAASRNDARLRELAAGLAYWAAEYQTLPGAPDSNAESDMPPARAIEAIELLPVARRGELKSLTGALPELNTFAPFREVISMIEIPDDSAAVLSELTNGFAEVLLANATTPLLAIAFVHCLTALYAVRNLTPHLSNETTRSAVRYGWQAAAALYTVLGTTPHSNLNGAAPALGRDDLIERALRSGDEHAIKYTEACLSEDVRSPSPIYLRAAHHAIGLLNASS